MSNSWKVKLAKDGKYKIFLTRYNVAIGEFYEGCDVDALRIGEILQPQSSKPAIEPTHVDGPPCEECGAGITHKLRCSKNSG